MNFQLKTKLIQKSCSEHLRHYPPYTDTDEGRFMLVERVTQRGQVIKDPSTLVHGFSPWPNGSAFLQIAEKFRFQNKIDFSDIETFFECGSSYGQTSISMSKFFNVHAVEILEKKQCKREGLKYPINWIEGDGTQELERYVRNNPNERLFILLDDHTQEYGCWIMQQLEVLKLHSKVNNHVIFVDDTDHFGIGQYPTYEQFHNKVKSIQHRRVQTDRAFI